MGKKIKEKHTIKSIVRKTNGNAIITSTNKKGTEIEVNASYMTNHKPIVGGTFVKYEDGTQGFTPELADKPKKTAKPKA